MDNGRFLSQPPSGLYKLGTEYGLSVGYGQRSFSVPTPFRPLQTDMVQNMVYLCAMDRISVLSQPLSGLYKLGTEYGLSVRVWTRSEGTVH